jgi:hypothetical protein
MFYLHVGDNQWEKSLIAYLWNYLIILSLEIRYIAWLTTIDIISTNENGVYDIDKKVTLDEYDEEIIEIKVHAGYTYNFREATETEKRFIIHTEREVLLEMKLESKSDAVRYGLWESFKNKVNAIILKELNIDYYYNSYKIIFNQDHILQKYEEFIDDLLLSKEEREETQKILNEAIIERLNDNSSKRQNRALKETKNYIGIIGDEKLNRRVNDNYLGDNKKLVDTLINVDAINITTKIKRLKINKNLPFQKSRYIHIKQI